jgi:hypothetical protein
VKEDSNHVERFERRVIAWFMGGVVVLAFIGGVVVDVDHPLAWVLGISYGRFLHPYFAVAGIGFVSAGLVLAIACICRCLQLRVLKKRNSQSSLQ